MKTKHLKDHVALKLKECGEKNIQSQLVCNRHTHESQVLQRA